MPRRRTTSVARRSASGSVANGGARARRPPSVAPQSTQSDAATTDATVSVTASEKSRDVRIGNATQRYHEERQTKA